MSDGRRAYRLVRGRRADLGRGVSGYRAPQAVHRPPCGCGRLSQCRVAMAVRRIARTPATKPRSCERGTPGAGVGGLDATTALVGSIFDKSRDPGTGPCPVFVDEAGRARVRLSSSKQFEDEIEPMDKAAKRMLERQPVRFRTRRT